MPDETRPDISLENNIATWPISAEGPIAGTYIGVFKFKCFLDPIEQIKANREYRELLGVNPLAAPEHETWLAYALTQLKYRVISAPPFWNSSQDITGMSGNIPDENIIAMVLEAATDAEFKYREQLKKKKEIALERAKKAAEQMIKEQQQETAEGENAGQS